jgi:chemotaxis regulatin CheY-phosphate phosphatase CheZ
VASLSQEQLQDSEETLRLVDDLVAELARKPDEDRLDIGVLRMLDSLAERRGDVQGIEGLLLRMYAELQRILYSVRKSRGLLEEAAIGHLESTTAKLKEVSSATEFAASNMLDGVDRALGLVDHVQATPDDGAAFDALRDELHALVVALQFQDITSQQLDHASAIIADLEHQLRRVTQIFALTVLREVDDDGPTEAAPLLRHPMGAFDPAASTNDAASRQAVADDIFKVG